MIEFVRNEEIYRKVILEAVPSARKYLWIATADVKDMYVAKARGMVPFLKVLADLVQDGVLVRLVHAKEPGPNFRRDFDRYPVLVKGLERLLCPRCHFKSVIVDGVWAYAGSANLTGAGMGAKSPKNRNFENGFVTTDRELVSRIMEQFDELWMGRHCRQCGRSGFCSEYGDMVRQ
jgi:phosphatidylserine/phosphatidylglycerophosphate/cardiolipin synthase-like enzyme